VTANPPVAVCCGAPPTSTVTSSDAVVRAFPVFTLAWMVA
jgi:hypothetical protein